MPCPRLNWVGYSSEEMFPSDIENNAGSYPHLNPKSTRVDNERIEIQSSSG